MEAGHSPKIHGQRRSLYGWHAATTIIGAVRHRIYCLATLVIVLFATLSPLANCFDTWDKNPAPASDTEMHVAAWFAGAGFVLVMAKLVRVTPSSSHKGRLPGRVRRVPVVVQPDESRSPIPTASPPLLPLRI